jgi:tRNA(Ile2) C34 agmatinyltransferase TiaS
MFATMLAFAVACGAGMVLSLRAAARRPRRRCPACRVLLVVREHDHFRCRACGAEYYEEGGKGLVPKEAWLAGAREPIPAARLVE